MKTGITKEIECKLANKYLKTALRFAFEVPISNGKDFGYVDFITTEIDFKNFSIPKISCYEIKISVSDFKSVNGHNLYGDFNWYVVTEEVYEWLIKEENMGHLEYGIIVYKNGKLFIKKNAFENTYKKMPIEYRFRLLDDILVKWESGTMYRMLKECEIDLRN